MENLNVGVKKPFYRIHRTQPYNDSYILDKNYASDRFLLCRAYKILEEDLLKLFQYVEPSDENSDVFSQRTYELFLRASTEFETNCKQILLANGYKPKGNWSINDYQKIERATKLSEYEIKLNIWHPGGKIFKPLASWKSLKPLDWYQDYNKVKHDRSNNFQKAKLINVVNAVSAVWAVLYAQFSYYIFEPYNDSIGLTSDDNTGFEYSDSTLFSIKPFKDWAEEEKYIFDWSNEDEKSFQKFKF